jgi:uncharacterized DUF497 family protein
MATKIVYHFEWDEEKARANFSKHKVVFDWPLVYFVTRWR